MYTNTKKPAKTILLGLFLLIAIAITGLFTISAYAETFPWGEEPDVSLKVNGKILQTDVPPKIINSRTMIPARALFEEIGGTVTWDQTNYVVTINYNNQVIKLTINSKTALVDGTQKTLDVPAQIVNNRTLIPLRFVSENLGFTVDYDNKTRTAIVNVPDNSTKTDDSTEAANTINKVTVTHGSDSNMYTTVKIVSSKALSSSDYKTMVLGNPDRYVIDFLDHKDTSGSTKTLYSTTNTNSAVASIRAAMFETTTFRIVFDLNKVETPTIAFSSDKKEMTVTFKAIGSSTQPSDSTDNTDNTGDKDNTSGNDTTVVEPDPEPEPVVFEPYADGKLVVMLDPGHGESTAGKRSPDGTLREYEFNRDVAKRLKAILEQNGITVLMTVDDDTTDVSLSERASKANTSIADIFVSIHANAFGNGVDWENDAVGWEIYYYSEDSYGKTLAEYIHKANVSGGIGIKDRGVKTANFAVIKNTNIPAVLIEHGFYTSQTEVELLKSSTWRQKCAELDAQGIINFLNSFK